MDSFILTNRVHCGANHSEFVLLLFHVTDQSEGQYLSKLPSSERHFILTQLKSDHLLLPTWFVIVILTCCQEYRIAGNFRGRKLLQTGEKYDFHRENFRRLLACAMPKDATPPNFVEKNFTATKPGNLRRFSPLKVCRYMIYGSFYCSYQ